MNNTEEITLEPSMTVLEWLLEGNNEWNQSGTLWSYEWSTHAVEELVDYIMKR